MANDNPEFKNIAINRKCSAFCQSHGLRFVPANKTGLIIIGQSGFHVPPECDEETLNQCLFRCLKQHQYIEEVKWRDGLLHDCLERIGESELSYAAIEDELAANLPPESLDIVARTFWKYGGECRVDHSEVI